MSAGDDSEAGPSRRNGDSVVRAITDDGAFRVIATRTTEEWIEWGNPNEKPAWDYMVQYSPYDNVKKQNYPATLIKVSVNDSQVPYWEGAKLVAKLRAMKTDKNPLLLKVNFGAGHGGSSGRYDALRETAYEYAFMLWQMGVTEDVSKAGQ